MLTQKNVFRVLCITSMLWLSCEKFSWYWWTSLSKGLLASGVPCCRSPLSSKLLPHLHQHRFGLLPNYWALKNKGIFTFSHSYFPVYCSHWLISIPWKHFNEMLVSLIRLFYGKMPKIASNNNPYRETYEKSRTLCEYNRKSHRIFRAERKNASCSNKSHKAHTQKAIWFQSATLLNKQSKLANKKNSHGCMQFLRP